MSAAAISAPPGFRRAATSRSPKSLLGKTDYDGYFLEYDTDRAGGFEPLRFLPKGNKRVVLGLVTSKTGDARGQGRRSRGASRRRRSSRRSSSSACRPQCGFASTEEGNILTEDQQWAKMREIVEIADEVWGKCGFQGLKRDKGSERIPSKRTTINSREDEMLGRMQWRSPGRVVALAAAAAAVLFAGAAAAKAQEIKIGFSMALTGPLAPNGKPALLGVKIWEETINKKGGLLGRQVKLIYYDDQSNPSTVPGIYTKLLDVDKVDLVVGPYATTMIAPAMPVIMQKGKVFIACSALAREQRVQLSEIFRDDPDRTEPEAVLHRGLLRGRGAAESASRRPSRWSPPTRSSPAMPAKAPARTPRSTASDRLRPHLSADHDRLLADRARDRRRPIRIVVNICSYPLEFGRHGARGQRGRLQAEDDRRRAWSACRRPCSRRSSVRCSTAGSITRPGCRRRRC